MAAEHRNLNAKASIADIASEVENDFWEIVRNLAQAQRMSTKTGSCHSSQGSEALQEVCQAVAQTDRHRDEEGESQDVQGVQSNDRCGFLTILANILTVG